MAGSENSSCDDNFSGSEEVKSKDDSQVHQFSKDEEEMIIRMYNLVGERWSIIAGRIPGRTADEIKNYWIFRDPAAGGGLENQKIHCQER